MSFSSEIQGRSQVGNRSLTYGKWEADGDDGGNIDTGLRVCEILIPVQKGSAGLAKTTVVNEDLPADGSAITIHNGSSTDIDGNWVAIGY